MSLSGPSKVGAFGVVFLGVIAVLLVFVVFSLDRFHGETRNLTDAVQEFRDRQATAGSEIASQLEALRKAQESNAKTLADAMSRMQVSVDSSGSGRRGPVSNGHVGNGSKPDEPKTSPGVAKRYPIGGAMMNRSEEPSTLNRWTSNEGAIRQMMNYVHDGLFNLNLDLTLRPTLASHWEISEDKLRYTFHLRKGVKFSDGTPFTSEDVAYTLRLIQDPEVNSDYYRADYKDVAKVETPDAHTVVFHYKIKHWRGIYAIGLNLKVISAAWTRKKVEQVASADRAKFPEGAYSTEPGEKGFGKVYNEIRDPSVGTGPYLFDHKRSWVKNQHLTLYRNPDSWWFKVYPGKYNLAATRWRFIRDDVVLWEEVRKQKLDSMVVDHNVWYDRLSKDPSITDHFNFYQYDHVGLGHSIIYWNCRKPLLSDKKVRLALAHLIDRETMLNVFKKGVGKYATCYFKPTYPEYSTYLKPILKDLPKAKRLLADAGWKDTNGDGILDKDGVDFRFTMLMPRGRDEFRIFSQLWQSDMKKAGIDMKIRSLEWAAFIKEFYDHSFDGCYLYNSHTDPWIEPYDQFLSTKTGKGESNHSGVKNTEIDQLLEAARTEFDRKKRIKLFQRFNELMYEEQAERFILHGLVSVVSHKRFRNVKVTQRGLAWEDWYVPPELRRYDKRGNPIRRKPK